MKNIIISAIISLLIPYRSLSQCWQKIAIGGNHNLALKTNNTLWTWGANSKGQLGDGTTTNRNTPLQITNTTNWDKIAAGVSGDHNLAIKLDGTLWAWGYNFYGQLGDGTGTDRTVPTQIGTATNWSQVAAGLFYSLALKTDGTIWAWGRNTNGQLGIGSNLAPNDIKVIPTQVGTATDWVKIIAGDAHSIAIKADGTLWAWGFNLFGQLGNGLNADRLVPTQIGTATNWSHITGGDGHTGALKTDGTLWTWGDNQYVQLGNGTTGPGTNTNTPLQSGIATNWANIGSGEFHNFNIKTDGTLWGWGRNEWSQLGDGTNINKSTPVQIGNANNWKQARGGRQHSFALKTDGSLWATGRNTFGQLGDGTNISQTNLVQVNCIAAVPVTWLYVHSMLQQNKAVIKWATATERNSQFFEIEHSVDGINFTVIGTKTAAGNSTLLQYYEFEHQTPLTGKNYYRIKQIDSDRRFSYSSIVSFNKTDQVIQIAVVPNPANNYIVLSTEKKDNLYYRILNREGRQVKAGFTIANRVIPVSGLVSGLYLLQCENQAIKFLKE